MMMAGPLLGWIQKLTTFRLKWQSWSAVKILRLKIESTVTGGTYGDGNLRL